MAGIFSQLSVRLACAVVMVLVMISVTVQSAAADTQLRAPAATCDFYAAPNGSPSNRGTLARPWDLQTALNQPAALKRGMTLCLRGGTYAGTFVSSLNGAAGQKITVRSAPGEWAVLDGYVYGVLASPIAAAATTLPLVDASRFPSAAVLIGAMLGTDDIRIYGRTGNTLTVYDNLSTAHPQGTLVVAHGAALTVNGSHVVFRDFEILNSNPSRTDSEYSNRAAGLNVYAPESQILNLVIHDTLQGLGFWEQARNSVACGNILYNNGQVGHGHGIYTQNEVGTKLLCDNITFGNFGFGMQMYTTHGGKQVGFTWDGNVNVNNRYLFGGQKPMDDLTVTNNFLYGATVELGYGDAGPHGSAVVSGNYVYAEFPLSVLNWNSVAVMNNTFYMMPTNSGAVVRVNLPVNGTIGNYTFANNHYLFGRSWLDMPFLLKAGAADNTGHQMSSWQTLVGDTTSTYAGATEQSPTVPRPTGLDLFYRANPHEVGRGNIIIYNHDGASQVSLDLARVGLPIGQPYQIRNGQDFLAPPITVGTYSGAPVSVSLNALVVAQPFTDNGERNLDTCPEFCVLVVVPQPNPTEQGGNKPVKGENPTGRQPTKERDARALSADDTGTGDRSLSTTFDASKPGWTAIPAQFNADALTDAFLFNTESGEWVMAISTPTGFSYPFTGSLFPGWTLYPGDFTGDGLTDLLLHDQQAGTFVVATAGASGFTYQQGSWPPGWTPVVTDLNADGRDDLLLYAVATGQSLQLISNGKGKFTNVGRHPSW